MTRNGIGKSKQPGTARSRAAAGGPRKATVRRIRSLLGRTQGELAHALGVSEKAVQSYEQGWRKVPVRVMVQLLVLLAIQRKASLTSDPCWEVKGCPVERRSTCPSFLFGKGQFCWFIGSRDCGPKADDAGVLPCMNCAVIRRLLQPSPARNSTAEKRK